jgi:signal transduction histidine kinase
MDPEENQFYNSILIVAAILGIIVVYFIVSIIRHQRRNVKQRQERTFAEITMQENERKRIANDLHDSLGPLLSSVKLNINSIDAYAPQDKVIIEKAGKYIDEIIANMRQISYDLLPNTLQRKGLVEAIQEFATNITQKKGLIIDLHLIKNIQTPRGGAIHIFRMLQEIIHNTIKHAHAKTLQIGLSEENGHLLIFTKDDGAGFDVEKYKTESSGLGLKSIESRVEILNGKLSIESKAEKGTSYFIKIPLSQQPQ